MLSGDPPGRPVSRKLTMKHLTSAILLAMSVVVGSGCNETNNPDPGNENLKPRESEWETVVNALPFPLSGDGKITTLTVGRKEYAENFANRGNIEILYDHADETITIDVRRYIFGDELDAMGDQAGTPGAFQRLSLWAFVGSGNPSKPSDQDPADDCTQGTWKDGCSVYAYYDGKSQPTRSGMDFRVHLPTGYRGKLFVTTEDNTAEDTYPRRGNLTIDGLCSGGDIRLQAGWAKIKLCRDLEPTPTCPAADIMTCDGWPDGSGSEAWSKDCPCGGGDLFGQLSILASQPWASNIMIDVPTTAWLNTTLRNTSTMKPHDCKPVIECPMGVCKTDMDDEYTAHAEYNYPSASAPSGAGFNLSVESGGCTVIPYVDSPDAWPGFDKDPPSELRGNLKVCTDCL